MKILVVDDERALVKGIKFNLENEGYTVDCGYDGNDAVNMAKKNNYDLIILDLMMPGKDGLEACQEIRSFSTVPVIMLTARSERHDLLLGFESGADDYITKPFDVLELKARVRALLRRAGISTAAAGEKDAGTVSHAQITLDEAQRSAFKDGKEVELTMKDTAAKSCWTWSGAMTISATAGRWTSISAACAKSLNGTPPRPS